MTIDAQSIRDVIQPFVPGWVVYPDYWLGNGALLQMYGSDNSRKALTVTVVNGVTYGGVAGYSEAAVAANGDYYVVTIPLAAGTYSWKSNYTKNTDYGKFDLYVGATKVSGATPLDCYAASASGNNEWAITGIAIAADGWYTFKILNVGKNAYSGDYRLWVGAITIFRTA